MSPDRPAGSAQRAVVDRVTEGVAVLLVGADEQEHTIDAQQLPPKAGEGAVLEVAVRDGAVTVLAVDEEATRQRRADLRSRMARLRSRSRRFGDRA